MLALLVDDAAALEVLLATTGRWLDLDAGVALGSDGSLDVHRLDAMAGTFDQLCRLAAAEEFDDGRFLRLVTDSVIGWGSSLASALASAIPAIGATAAKVAPLAVDALSDWLVARGVLPPDADTAATLAHGRYEGRVSWAATVAISATVASLVDAGALPATSMEELASALDDDAEGDGCAVRDLHDRLLDYVTSMRGRCDPAVANALDTILESFLSAPYINGVCA